jgi:hypothetical protein
MIEAVVTSGQSSLNVVLVYASVQKATGPEWYSAHLRPQTLHFNQQQTGRRFQLLFDSPSQPPLSQELNSLADFLGLIDVAPTNADYTFIFSRKMRKRPDCLYVHPHFNGAKLRGQVMLQIQSFEVEPTID